jgi:hypothetical protein
MNNAKTVAELLEERFEPGVARPATPRRTLRASAVRILLHVVALLVAVGCLALYAHLAAEGRSRAALVSLVAAAVIGLVPVRDVLHLVFGIEGKALHAVHALAGIALIALPLTGAVSSAPVLTHAALAPFALMGAAQAVMHQHHPRNAKQAAALRRFAESLPEVAQFTTSRNLASPANVARAIAVLTDVIGKAQALGETELEADPNFQSALAQASTRVGTNLGLDAVRLALAKLASNPASATAVPRLEAQLAKAQRTISATRAR